MPRLVLFDLDGTLFDTAEDLCRSVEFVCEAMGYPATPVSAIKRMAGHGLRNLARAHLAHHGIEVPEDVLDTIARRSFERYAERMVVATRPFPGAIDALYRLAGRGVALAIASNKTERLIVGLLDHFNVTELFSAVTGGNTYAYKKPDARAVLQTIARAGGTPHRTVMVGDTDTDIAAARGAGIPVIGVSFGYATAPLGDLSGDLGPDALIDHFDELDAAIAQVLDQTGVRRPA